MTDKDTLPQRQPDGKFEYKKGSWWPLWALFMVPFLLVFKPIYTFVKKEVDWKAAWLTVLVFEAVLMPAEYYALTRGHWVYNENRIFGPKIFGVPIEEPLLYYLFSPLILISVFHLFKKMFSKTKIMGDQ